MLPLTPQSDALPELVLESGDRIYIPPQPTTVGVFGSVFSAGSYLHSGSRTVGDYIRLAGGPTRGADDQSTFVVRANGSVKSSLQESGYFSRGNQLAGAVAGAVKVKLPGTDATPPLKVELASVWPNVIALALGAVVMVGIALDITWEIAAEALPSKLVLPL